MWKDVLWEPLTVIGLTVSDVALFESLRLRCASCLSDQITLLLVSLGKGSKEKH